MDIERIRNKVMDSKYSAYDIQKKTGVSTSTIYDLRRGKRDFENLTVKIVKKLDEYFKNQK
ncbi:helix-turn-helix domain-containing protein [Ligilactobacillus salivarius]|uniref:helix-turn-helix domain-containing protein n=1 Tax=Ligilactobacillus salivarius TaxID=1624 RepID=UPI0006693277|nr:helix-turn-helix transcriptional regulator [Ligilactobacillus salivarius]